MSPAAPQLFQPIQIGATTLKHRVVLAPLTRYRAIKHIPVVPLVREHYSQRGSIPGTLLITEGTVIAAKAGGHPSVPGIWSNEQIRAWKEVTDAVHAKGSSIFLQIWALGRAADPVFLASSEPPLDFVAPSPIPLSSSPAPIPRELTVAEIQDYVQLFAQAAKNAVEGAGFDGVEIHGANGYLVDQFLQGTSNHRSDGYGGSVEARSRFALEVIDAVSKAVGPGRTAIRLSPWSTFQDMAMEDPVPQFTHFISALRDSHPDLAYLHVVEPRITGDDDRNLETHEHTIQSNDFIRAIWRPRPYVSAGGYTRESALQAAEEGDLIAFGRIFTSNPDLPLRLRKNLPLTPYNRKTFYVFGDQEGAGIGYVDYPFAESLDEIETGAVEARL